MRSRGVSAVALKHRSCRIFIAPARLVATLRVRALSDVSRSRFAHLTTCQSVLALPPLPTAAYSDSL